MVRAVDAGIVGVVGLLGGLPVSCLSAETGRLFRFYQVTFSYLGGYSVGCVCSHDTAAFSGLALRVVTKQYNCLVDEDHGNTTK